MEQNDKVNGQPQYTAKSLAEQHRKGDWIDVLSKDALQTLEYKDGDKYVPVKPEDVKPDMFLRVKCEMSSPDGRRLSAGNEYHALGKVNSVEFENGDLTMSLDHPVQIITENGVVEQVTPTIATTIDVAKEICGPEREAPKPTKDAPAPSTKHDLTMQDLVNILSQGNTWNEIKQAVKDQEITEAELKKVLEYVKTPMFDKDGNANPKAEELFKDILANIKSQPSFNTTEELQQWQAYGRQVADTIKTLRQEQAACEQAMGVLKESIQRAEKDLKAAQDRNEDVKDLIDKVKKQQADMRAMQEKLDVRTKQIAALTLVELHAKTPEQQQENTQKIKAREPLIKSLINSWKTQRDQAKELGKVIEMTRDLSKADKAKDRFTKIELNAAKAHVKEYNKLKENISKEEAKLIKAAQKIADTEFRKAKHLNRLEHWSKGVPIDKDLQRVQVKDAEMARSIIDKTDVVLSDREQRKVDSLMANLDEMKTLMKEHEDGATKALGRIASVLDQRRERVKEAMQSVIDKERSGQLGHVSERKMEQIERNFADAMEYTYIDPDLLQGSAFQRDLDMAGFMKDHGLDGMILDTDEFEIDR